MGGGGGLYNMFCSKTNLRLNHGRTLRPQNPDRLEEIDYALALHPLQHDAQWHEHARPAHAAAVKIFFLSSNKCVSISAGNSGDVVFSVILSHRRLTPDENITRLLHHH